MGRGKVETKYIERKDHRQVTFSKRKNGLRKKIIELSVMCNAEIALIIFSKTGRLHQHSGEDTSVKQVVHRYLQHPQAQLRYDQIVRTSHSQGGGGKKFELCEFYEQLREMLCKNLDSMNHSELQILEDQLENATQTVRKRKEDLVNRELHALEKDNQRLYKLNKEHESKMTTGKCIATDLHAQEFRNQNGYENVLSIISDDRCSTVLSMESSLYSGVDEEPAVPPQTSAKLAAKRGQSYEQRPLLLNLI